MAASMQKIKINASLYSLTMGSCYVLAGMLEISGKPKGRLHTETRSKDIYCLVATASKCVPAIHKVYSYSVIRTARPEVLKVLLYVD